MEREASMRRIDPAGDRTPSRAHRHALAGGARTAALVWLAGAAVALIVGCTADVGDEPQLSEAER